MSPQQPLAPKPRFPTRRKKAQLRHSALEYHEFPTPGKIAVTATKQLIQPARSGPAYSPGVVARARRSSRTPTTPSSTPAAATSWPWSQRHGRTGPGRYRSAGIQAGHGRQRACCSRSSPVSTCLTSKSTKRDLDRLVDIIALEPTFGGINLEDIKAPDCFYVERKLRERMKIRSSTTTSTARPSASERPF